VFLILGDTGYGMKEWLMTPIFRNPTQQAERKYNRAHKSTRTIIEFAFGVLKNRFPCLKYMRLDPCYAGKVIMACATLHNIATKEDFDYNVLDNDNNIPSTNEAGVQAERRLNELLVYFA